MRRTVLPSQNVGFCLDHRSSDFVVNFSSDHPEENVVENDEDLADICGYFDLLHVADQVW